MRLLSNDEILPLLAQPGFAAPGVRDDLLNDADCGTALRVYVALTDGRLGADLTPEDRFYNRYYWFRRFANLHKTKFGPDAGIEQQAFQILEYPDCEVDWSQVEELDAAAGAAH